MFDVLNKNHTKNTTTATFNLLHIPQVRTLHFGELSIRFKVSQPWNELQRNLNLDLLNNDTSDFKKSIFETFFINYNNV